VTIEIEGTQFFTAQEVAAEAGVTRQTLWRWRRAGKIPPGSRFRNRQILYTAAECREIRDYANFLEPLSRASDGQLSMFD
jgi:transposase-like protein